MYGHVDGMGRCVCVREVERRSQRDWLFCYFFLRDRDRDQLYWPSYKKEEFIKTFKKKKGAGVNFIH